MSQSFEAELSLTGLEGADSVQPVSYTHLDVYKRQQYGWASAGAMIYFLIIMAILGALMLLIYFINRSRNRGYEN